MVLHRCNIRGLNRMLSVVHIAGLSGRRPEFRFSSAWEVVLLEVLQLMNQCRNLVTLLFMGQTAFWVCAHSGLICLNAVVTPILHFSPRIQSNTFFLTIFDAVMDTTFGAVLPACMLAEVATWFVTDSEMEMATHRSPRAIQKLIQASMIARGLWALVEKSLR